MSDLIVVEKCSDPDSMHAVSRPVALFTNSLAAQRAVQYSSDARALSIARHTLPTFDTAEAFWAWERQSDPDYKQYLRLKQKFETG
jgi:hypothetical protein